MLSFQFLATCFIEAALANVSNPLDDIMVTVVQLRFKDLQIANFETRRREWNLDGHRTPQTTRKANRCRDISRRCTPDKYSQSKERKLVFYGTSTAKVISAKMQ